jgi:serralysin
MAGEPIALADIPHAASRERIASLPAFAQERVLATLKANPSVLDQIHGTHIGNSGTVCHANCFHGARIVPAQLGPVAAVTQDDVVRQSVLPARALSTPRLDPFPVRLESRPGSWNTLLLDFKGLVITNTYWNEELGQNAFYARPFDTDGIPGSFSDEEQRIIKQVWNRVVEDFAPFDINVTTVEPENYSSKRFARVVFTKSRFTNSANKSVLMPGAGAGGLGIAKLGTFNNAQHTVWSKGHVVFVYTDALQNIPNSMGYAASHEFGHTLGLSHDGLKNPRYLDDRTRDTEYYGVHGENKFTTWSPIMGGGFSAALSQWSAGDYSPLSNNREDDIVIIRTKLGQAPLLTTTIYVDSNGNIPTGIIDNMYASVNAGVIASKEDFHELYFAAGIGTAKIGVSPWVVPNGSGSNLTPKVELWSPSGVLIAAKEPEATGAISFKNIAFKERGAYKLKIWGWGYNNGKSYWSDYGSMGRYVIGGKVPPWEPKKKPAASPAGSSLAGDG